MKHYQPLTFPYHSAHIHFDKVDKFLERVRAGQVYGDLGQQARRSRLWPDFDNAFKAEGSAFKIVDLDYHPGYHQVSSITILPYGPNRHKLFDILELCPHCTPLFGYSGVTGPHLAHINIEPVTFDIIGFTLTSSDPSYYDVFKWLWAHFEIGEYPILTPALLKTIQLAVQEYNRIKPHCHNEELVWVGEFVRYVDEMRGTIDWNDNVVLEKGPNAKIQVRHLHEVLRAAL